MKQLLNKYKYILVVIVLISILMFNKDVFSYVKYKVNELSPSLSGYTFGSTVTLTKGVDLVEGNTESIRKKNTINLQNAIDELSSSGGGILNLPSGTYYFAEGGSSPSGEQYAIKPKNNVKIVGAGNDETTSSKRTTLKPYYRCPNNGEKGSMDMFYFNNYKDANFPKDATTSTKVDVPYIDINGKSKVLENQTVYLINADFSDFIIDGAEVKGCTYETDGKGFMINVFKDCDWENVTVKNTDATGFGVDCPINSTITNCKAINCGKQATPNSEGASGFGIGTGYSSLESMIIKNSIALNNKKFGFFFEHQARFSGNRYPATSSKGFVVSNSVAGGNKYDFGGLKAYDLTYENNKSVSGSSTYDGIKLNTNVQKIYFSLYSKDIYLVGNDITHNVTDITSAKKEITWALNKGLFPLIEETKANVTTKVNRFDALKSIYYYENQEGKINYSTTTDEKSKMYNLITKYGYTDLGDYKNDLDIIEWGVNKGLISKDNKFNPEVLCSRKEFVTMLYRLAGKPKVSIQNPFTDVKEDAWYYDAVLWAYEKAITKGTTKNSFAPDAPITIQTASIMLARYDKTINNYKIVYNLNDGKISSPVTSYKSSSLPITLKTPTKTGYTFLGWTGSNSSVPVKTVKIATNTTGDLVYTANWKEKEPVTLSGIKVKDKPEKLDYYVGEMIDTKGLKLTATYSDGTTKTITSGYTISPLSFNKEGTSKVKVTYNGKTTSFDVNVDALEVTLDKIEVIDKPYKQTYFIGDKVDTDGLKLKAYYSDGTTRTVTSGYTISPKTLSKVGNTKVNIKYQDKQTYFFVVVEDIVLERLTINTNPTKTNYYVGEEINTNGLKLNGYYSNGERKVITTGFKISPSKLDKPGKHKITVSLLGKTTSFSVNVDEVKVSSIEIDKLPNKIGYFKGDSFSSKGLSVKVLYNNNVEKVITKGFKLSFSENKKLNTEGTKTISVTYEGYKTDFKVNVNPVNERSLILVSKPTKLTYLIGETFNSSGLALEYMDSYGNRETITNGYKLSIKNGTELNVAGNKKVTVTYDDKNVTFYIEVLQIRNVSVKKGSVKTTYFVGETFNPEGMVLKLTYSNGITKETMVSIKTKNKVFTELGKETLTINYNGFKFDLEVDVVKKEDGVIEIPIVEEPIEEEEMYYAYQQPFGMLEVVCLTILAALGIVSIFVFRKKK